MEFGDTMLTLRIIKARSHNGLLEPVANDSLAAVVGLSGSAMLQWIPARQSLLFAHHLIATFITH